MPSFSKLLKKGRRKDTREDDEPAQIPEIRVVRQLTEPLEVDVFSSVGLPTTQFHGMHLEDTPEKTPTHTTQPSEKTQTLDTPTTPSRSNSKRLSGKFISSLTRRPSQMSRRSRSSSYVPEFKPIDRSADIEAQWEERATMLAKAGPPSPALPRSDSVFHLAGPPQIPAMKFVPALTRSTSEKRLSVRVETPPRPMMNNRQRSTSSNVIDEETLPIHDMTKDDLLQLAIREHEGGNLEKAAQLFKKSAQGEDGLPIGQLMYGLSLRHGWGVQKDEAKAIHWLRLAATSSADHERDALGKGQLAGGEMKGDLILAIFELGNCFRHGWGVERDKDLARNYYETAANLGDSDAMCETAWCYETGFGTRKDKFKAAYWYRAAQVKGSKIPGMQWIWKAKYDEDPFIPEK